MIKLGCNAMLRDRDTPGQFIDVETLINLIQELQLGNIDFHLYRGFRSRDPEYLRRIKIQCQHYGLSIGYVGIGRGFVGASSRPGEGTVGAPLPEGTENCDALWATMIGDFQEVADYAAEVGIILGIHNHPPAVAPTGEDILGILRDIDRENVMFILDTGQWWGSPGTNRAVRFDPEVDYYAFMEQHCAVRLVRAGKDLQD